MGRVSPARRAEEGEVAVGWLESNMAVLLTFVGLGLLAIEVMVLGFAVVVLFFIGVGCLATGLLMFLGIIPATLVGALLGVALLTLLAATLLWKPLKRLQDKVDQQPVTSDLIGYSFTLETDVSRHNPGQVRFSGINWRVVSDADLPAGTDVQVVRTSVGELTVARLQ